jgi:multidrug efflux system membrane fusion protein
MDNDEKPPRSKRRRIIWIVVAIAAVVGLLWYIQPGADSGAKRGGRFSNSGPMPVVATEARKGDIDVTRAALGTVTPLATVTVQTQIPGQLLEIGFQEGQKVEKGDFLAQVDPRPYQATLDQAQSTLDRDQAILEAAKIDLARYQKLVAQDSIARQQAEDQFYTVQQDEGTVKLDQAAVESAKLNLDYCHIVAPLAGRVGLRLVDPGNYVQVGNATASATGSTSGSATGIAVITQLQPITVIFTLPEDDLPAVMKRLAAGAELQVTAFDRSQSTKLATGKLFSVDNQIDTATGTVRMRAQFDNDDGALFPNQFVNVELLVDTLHDATIVPTAAIQRGNPATFVYVVNSDNTVKVQAVKLGPTQNDDVAITEGVSPGDKVVTDGTDKLRDGAKITLPAEKGSDSGNGNNSSDAKSSSDKSNSDQNSHKHHRSNNQ